MRRIAIVCASTRLARPRSLDGGLLSRGTGADDEHVERDGRGDQVHVKLSAVA
jgi:hypothetical protein